MSDIKRVIIVWDDENYSNRAEAEAEDAVWETEIPNHLDRRGREAYLEGFREAMRAGGERLKANNRALTHEIVHYKPFTVQGRVLEWNEYTATVWAENSEQAVQRANEDGILSYSSKDVEWGVESAPKGMVNTQPVHIVV